MFARTLLRKLGGKHQAQRETLLCMLGFSDANSLKKTRKQEELSFNDFRVIDMYAADIRHDLKVYQDRKGNWVKKFEDPGHVNLFATAQLYRYRAIEHFLNEQFSDRREVRARAIGGELSRKSNHFVDQLLAHGKSRQVEFKASVEPIDEIGKAVSAFLNTCGCVVLIGVDIDGKPNGSASLA